MADRLAEETDFLVVVPDFFRSADGQDPSDPESFNWYDHLQYDYYDGVQKWLHEEKFMTTDCVAVGNGVGSYIAIHIGVDFMVKATFVTSPEHVEVVNGIQVPYNLFSPYKTTSMKLLVG